MSRPLWARPPLPTDRERRRGPNRDGIVVGFDQCRVEQLYHLGRPRHTQLSEPTDQHDRRQRPGPAHGQGRRSVWQRPARSCLGHEHRLNSGHLHRGFAVQRRCKADHQRDGSGPLQFPDGEPGQNKHLVASATGIGSLRSNTFTISAGSAVKLFVPDAATKHDGRQQPGRGDGRVLRFVRQRQQLDGVIADLCRFREQRRRADVCRAARRRAATSAR